LGRQAKPSFTSGNLASESLRRYYLRESIEDLGAKVQDLAVKETDTEVQIELAADVLFDFDKAELRSAGHDALKKAAGVIREKGGKTIRRRSRSPTTISELVR